MYPVANDQLSKYRLQLAAAECFKKVNQRGKQTGTCMLF